MNNPVLTHLLETRSQFSGDFLIDPRDPELDVGPPPLVHPEPKSYHRVKVQQFSSCPPELTVQAISFDRERKSYLNAWANGQASCGPRGGPRVFDPSKERSEEDIERSRRRAQRGVRVMVNELFPNHFTTFTTREDGSRPYLTPEDWKVIWAHFLRLVRYANLDFEYVGVLERHPSNPQHLHLHVAWRGRAHYDLLRRFWHIAICAHRGERVTKVLRGDKSPGNIQDQDAAKSRHRGPGYKRSRKIAKYISKYITKDLICEFNKKKYWASKGITVQKAQSFWLDSLTMSEAIREAFQLVYEWDYELDLPAQKIFNPSERLAWCAIDPGRSPPPF
jgi:hypothetical protein